jgi:hypothetical protein
MIESIMYFCIGFLSAILIAISVIPLIHARAVRLTTRRLENTLPQSMAEITADKDLQRAEFAVSTLRLETRIESLKERTASQLAEIGRKDDIINRLKVDRQAQQVEMLLLNGQVGSLKQQLCSATNTLDIKQSRPDEIEMMRVIPAEAPRPNAAPIVFSPASAAERVSVEPIAIKGSALNHERDPGAASLVPQEPFETLAVDSIVGNTGNTVPGHMFERETGSALRRNPSIYVSPADHFALDRPRQRTRLAAIGFGTVLIGVCGFSWAYYSGINPVIVSWTQAVIAMTSTTISKLSSPAAETASVPTPAQQPEDPARGVTDMRNAVEQFAAPQAESPNNSPAPTRSEQPKQAALTPAPQRQPKPAPVPDTPPTTMPGWIVREVANGTATVEGPNGIWRVARGDNLPGAGRVDSIVRWGHRWIIATSRGLISTP